MALDFPYVETDDDENEITDERKHDHLCDDCDEMLSEACTAPCDENAPELCEVCQKALGQDEEDEEEDNSEGFTKAYGSEQ